MKKRTLGRTGIDIAPLVFGGNVFGWTVDQARSFELLDRFVEPGFNAIDTAAVYSAWGTGLSGGESEKLLGQWLARRGRRDDIVLMTKVGMWKQRKGLSAANIEAAVEDSLKRLGTDYLDVYSAERLREALAVSQEQGLACYKVVQPLYNLHDREDFEGVWRHWCKSRSLAWSAASRWPAAFRPASIAVQRMQRVAPEP